VSPSVGIGASVRDDVAQGIAVDASSVATARRGLPVTSHTAAVADTDDPGFMRTRVVLPDEFGSRRDRALVAGIPSVDEVDAVVAYGSYSDFESERGTLEDDAMPGSQLVFKFGWSFFVPDSSDRSDDDLPREAVELAQPAEISALRAAAQRWRRNSFLKGQSDAEALRDMDALIAEYAEAARKRKINVGGRGALLWLPLWAGRPPSSFHPSALPPSLPSRRSCHHARSPAPRAPAMFHGGRPRFG
jgi:hypothetical protein